MQTYMANPDKIERKWYELTLMDVLLAVWHPE